MQAAADLIEEMISRGHPVGYVAIDGGWREIDTVEDLARGGLRQPAV